jgi:pyrrolidone-carboxylate peptidase
MLQKIKQLFKSSNNAVTTNTEAFIYKSDESNAFEKLQEKLNNYFLNNPAEKQHYKKELQFLGAAFKPLPGIEKIVHAIIPYPFTFEYDYKKIEVHRDEEAGMYYVYLDGKKLYYHKGFTNITDIQKSFTFITIEQHPHSPHRYLDEAFNLNSDDVVIDAGSAEGNFSLTIVDKVKELVIIEADSIWIEALQKTFALWKDKVRIINKFVGDKNDTNTITLDKAAGQNKITAIKMDIEGAEVSVLKNAEDFIRDSSIKMAVTTYHKQNDAADIKQILENNNYTTDFSNGYMLFIYDTLMPPYFRRGLIKATK